MHRGDDQITLVLAPVIVGDNDNLAFFKCADSVDDAFLIANSRIFVVTSINSKMPIRPRYPDLLQ